MWIVGWAQRNVGSTHVGAADDEGNGHDVDDRQAQAARTPSKPIDLGGTPGVTPAEQHRAETLLRETIVELKKYEFPGGGLCGRLPLDRRRR